MWKKGWCRNPLLYSPQQSHLVGEDDLDCNRGMGSYWEPIDHTASAADLADPAEAAPPAASRDTGRFKPPPPRQIAPATPPHQTQGARRTAQMRTDVEPIVVRRGNEESVARQRTRPGTRGAEPLRSRDPEGYNNAPQEHYTWGDYLRRSYPVIGVILLLGAFWVWSARQLAGGPQATPTVVQPTATAESATAATVVVITPSAPAAAGAAPTPTLPTPPPGVIDVGARVVITASGAGANIRQEPSINAAVVTSQDDGTALRITGPSQQADDFTWWPVQGDGFAGWIAEAVISPAP
jgi:hypothetical protein